MRLEKKITIIVAVCLVILGVCMMSVSILAAGKDFMNLISTVEYTERTIDIAEDFDEIKLELLSRDLEIYKSVDGQAHFICQESEDEKYTAEVKGNTLVITQKENAKMHISFVVVTPDVHNELYLPNKAYENFTCSLGSGDISMKEDFRFNDVEVKVGSGEAFLENFTAAELGVTSGSGSIGLKNLSADGVELKVGSGDVNIDGLAISKKLEAETHSGDIEINNIISRGSFSVSTGSGSIDLTDCQSVSMDAKTASGDINLKSCDAMSLNFKTGSGDVTGTLKTAKSFDADTGSGDIKVPADGNGGNCVIRTGSGDIEIEVEN
jgi:DUF4097 and DUF4098 domain-containing protein YvlB